MEKHFLIHFDLKSTERRFGESNKKRIWSKESKQKMSESHLGSKNPRFGKLHSSYSKQKMSESKKGKLHAPHSEETKKKISESKLGRKRRPFSEEHKKNLSLSSKGKKRGPYKPPDFNIV